MEQRERGGNDIDQINNTDPVGKVKGGQNSEISGFYDVITVWLLKKLSYSCLLLNVCLLVSRTPETPLRRNLSRDPR